MRNKPKDELNDWNYANISVIAKGVYRWSNRAGRSWTLTKNPDSPDKLDVGTDCPYYKKGHTEVTLKFDADGNVYAIVGPHDKVYYKPYEGQADAVAANIVGDYVRDKAKHKLKDYHYVEISPLAKGVYRWTDGRGRSWSLTQNQDAPEILEVSKKSYYYKRGHTEATLEFDSDGIVTGILGPWGSRYLK